MKQSTLTRKSMFSRLLVLTAVVKKEFKHFIRYPLSVAGELLVPVLWMIPIILVGELFGKNNTDGFSHYTGISDFRSFLILGTVLWNLISSIFFGIGFTLKIEMWQGTLEQNWLTPIKRVDILIARSLFNILITVIFTIFIILFCIFFLDLRVGGNFFLALGLIILTLIVCYGFGFVFSGMVLVLREPMAPAFIMMEIIPFLCGLMYPITVLPNWLQVLAKFIPFTYAIDGLRGILLGSKTILPIGQEMVLLCAFAILLPLVGYLTFTWIERRGRQLGTLGQY